MSPHKLFLLLLALSLVFTSVTFIKNANDLIVMLKILGVVGAIMFLALMLTRKYWKDARRISSC